jgi:hypothetical protein
MQEFLLSSGPTALANPSHFQEFDDQEDHAPIAPVEDDVAIDSAQDYQKPQDIRSQFYKMFPPSHANYYANPQGASTLRSSE